jgi:2-methylisocitrate lyase-like PEP mutase family enzyme
VIIGRTDSVQVPVTEEAVTRLNVAADACADVCSTEGAESKEAESTVQALAPKPVSFETLSMLSQVIT